MAFKYNKYDQKCFDYIESYTLLKEEKIKESHINMVAIFQQDIRIDRENPSYRMECIEELMQDFKEKHDIKFLSKGDIKKIHPYVWYAYCNSLKYMPNYSSDDYFDHLCDDDYSNSFSDSSGYDSY